MESVKDLLLDVFLSVGFWKTNDKNKIKNDLKTTDKPSRETP